MRMERSTCCFPTTPSGALRTPVKSARGTDSTSLVLPSEIIFLHVYRGPAWIIPHAELSPNGSMEQASHFEVFLVLTLHEPNFHC